MGTIMIQTRAIATTVLLSLLLAEPVFCQTVGIAVYPPNPLRLVLCEGETKPITIRYLSGRPEALAIWDKGRRNLEVKSAGGRTETINGYPFQSLSGDTEYTFEVTGLKPGENTVLIGYPRNELDSSGNLKWLGTWRSQLLRVKVIVESRANGE